MTTFANAMDPKHLGLQGLRVYFRDTNTTGNPKPWLDLGNVSSLTPQFSATTNDLKGARNGAASTIKTLTSDISDGFNFDTYDTTDPKILALHEGGTSEAIVLTGQTGAKLVRRNPGAKFTGEIAILEPGADLSTDGKMLYVPVAQIGGNGEAKSVGANASTLAFAVTYLSSAYVVPTAVIAGGETAPYGVALTVPASGSQISDMHAILDGLAS